MKYGFSYKKHKIFPPLLAISIINICNQKCIHCYYVKYKKLKDYKPHMMKWSVWKKIIDETSQYPGTIVNFATDGEPMIHKDFIKMLQYARKKKIFPINLTTNGTLLNNNKSEIIVKENLLDVLNVSLDAHKEKTYNLIRGGSLKKVKQYLLNFIKLNNQHRHKIKVQVNIINQSEVKNEIQDFIKYWTPKVDNVLIRTYYDATHVTGGTGPNITGKQKAFKKEERWPCQQFWRRFNISDDGTVRFCVDDWFNITKIGDLHKQSISEIWQSKEYDKLRRYHLKGEYNKIPYCCNCTEWQGMRWDYDYFTALEKMLKTKFV